MDWSGKHRPILERIALLCGRGIGLSLTFGGSPPEMTDQDVAAAVAMTRQVVRDGSQNPRNARGCVRPELLMLRHARQTTLVPIVARACAAVIGRAHIPVIVTRSTCVLAAQSIGGREIGPASVDHAAWACDVDPRMVAAELGNAAAWMEGELSEAERAFCKAMRRTDRQAA